MFCFLGIHALYLKEVKKCKKVLACKSCKKEFIEDNHDIYCHDNHEDKFNFTYYEKCKNCKHEELVYKSSAGW